MALEIPLGFEVGTGKPVSIPPFHTAVTGMTQQAGKTTALEAMVARSHATALAFVTKRGEGAFAGGHRVHPYFRDRADWQFVTSIIDATLQEKNKFLRPWIMRICRSTKTLADVQAAVRKALKTAKGIHEGVYTQLDEYLELIVPEITRLPLAASLALRPGLNVMDVSGYATPMQMLFVQSALDWVNERCRDTIVIIPEAWEFIPEGKGSPCKRSAMNLVRKGAGLGNYIWVDSQDMAGVDKEVLRGCAVWLIGVQREANEIKRNLANIPAGITRPKADDIAQLGRGEFYACWARHAVKTYVWPAWMDLKRAQRIARGEELLVPHGRLMTKAVPGTLPGLEFDDDDEEGAVDQATADRLQRENEDLKTRVAELQAELQRLRAPGGASTTRAAGAATSAPSPSAHIGSGPAGLPTRTEAQAAAVALGLDPEAQYQHFKARLLKELPIEPALLRVLTERPELVVEVERKTITMSGETLPGHLARMIAEGYFDETRKGYTAYLELQRRGQNPPKPNVYRELANLAAKGFLTREGDEGYKAVSGMKVNIVEK